MKKILLMKFCMCIIVVIPITTMNATAITNYEETTIFSTADKYRVTAQTNNEYGKNYWIDIVVEATVASYGTTIHGVFYAL